MVPKPFFQVFYPLWWVWLLTALLAGSILPGSSSLAILAHSLADGNEPGAAVTDAGYEFADQWARAKGGWESRSDHTSVALPDGTLLLMGGTTLGYYHNDVWRTTDPSAAWWRPMTGSAEWSARSGLTGVVLLDGSVVIMGGKSGGYPDYVEYNDVWRSTDMGATWTLQTAHAEWSARTGHTSVTLPDESIVLMGGSADENWMDDVWRSTDMGATWTLQTAHAEWSVRAGHTSMVLPDGSIVLMGGSDESNRFNDVWRSTDSGETWTLLTASAGWTARSEHTSVVLPSGSIVLMGGYNGNTRLNDNWQSTDQGATWTELIFTSTKYSSRSGHTSVALPDSSIVLMGGLNYAAPYYTYMNDTWRSVDDGANWKRASYINWSAREGHTSVALPDGSVVLIGGFDGDARRDVRRSTDEGANWTTVEAFADWLPRYDHTSVALPDGSIVLMGGRDGYDHYNDVWRSVDKGASWTQQTASAEWLARYAYASVSLPDGSIVLMGGRGAQNSYYNDVWRSTDNGATWTLLNAHAAWSARGGHTSVALPDGSIVLMGGYDIAGLSWKNDVWRSTDLGATWTLMTSAAAWTPRDDHASVALPDGSIVLMGGYDGNRRNDVWCSTDQGVSWVPMTSAVWIWSERSNHSSVVLPNGNIVLMGGSLSAVSQINDVWRLEALLTTNNTVYLPLLVR